MSHVANEKGVWRIDDDHVFQPDRGNQALIANDHGVFRIPQDHVATLAVALLIRVEHGFEVIPGANIQPVHVCGQDDHPLGIFHDAVVNCLLGKTRPQFSQYGMILLGADGFGYAHQA